MRICPQEAIQMTPPIVEKGRLIRRLEINLDSSKCNFCGECVVLCPMNAIQMIVNGERKIPIVESKAFPALLKERFTSLELCEPSCEFACEKACPRQAIKVRVEGKRKDPKILSVDVDLKKCIFCKQCMDACPYGAIEVKEFFLGIHQLNATLCPEGCVACTEICPSKSLEIDEDGKPVVDEKFCIHCGACERVCEVACKEKPIDVKITGVRHTDVESGAWTSALKKLASEGAMAKEVNSTSMQHLRKVITEVLT